MAFTFNSGIPGPNDLPSESQPLILQNFSSDSGIWAVDHIGFNTANGGTHEQITFVDYASVGAPSGHASFVYPAAGVADNSKPQVYFKSQNGTFPLSAVRAWAVCDTTGAILSSQSSNISSIVSNGGGAYTVSLTANAVKSSVFGISVTATTGSPANNICFGNGQPTGTGTFTLQFYSVSTQALRNPPGFTFVVYQL